MIPHNRKDAFPDIVANSKFSIAISRYLFDEFNGKKPTHVVMEFYCLLLRLGMYLLPNVWFHWRQYHMDFVVIYGINQKSLKIIQGKLK